jgi:hypothetical protein
VYHEKSEDCNSVGVVVLHALDLGLCSHCIWIFKFVPAEDGTGSTERPNWRAFPMASISFFAQSHERVHTGRTPGGDVAGKKRDAGENAGDRGEG